MTLKQMNITNIIGHPNYNAQIFVKSAKRYKLSRYTKDKFSN